MLVSRFIFITTLIFTLLSCKGDGSNSKDEELDELNQIYRKAELAIRDGYELTNFEFPSIEEQLNHVVKTGDIYFVESWVNIIKDEDTSQHFFSCEVYLDSLENEYVVRNLNEYHILDSATAWKENVYNPPPDVYDLKELDTLVQTASHAVAYNFNLGIENAANCGYKDCYLFDPLNKELNSSAYNKRELSNEDKVDVIKIITDTSTYTDKWYGLAGTCFVPHLGFGFYANDSLLASVSICFICDGIRTYPLYKSDGLSAVGREKLLRLCQRLGLAIIE